jgi:NTE family protein
MLRVFGVVRAACSGLLVSMLACGVWAIPAAGQDTSTEARPGRPRIGLALGGGSARGFVHLGVLRWFDEHRIPVDFVAGTSMGGLMGAAAATGMTPDEAQRLVQSLDWSHMLAPDSPFRDKTFRRKEDARAFPSVLEVGLKAGFRMAGGLSSAEQISLFFDRVALPYYGVTDFDDFPIPFRCVAVDLRTSEAITLRSGRLQDALRATMAIPGVFAPVRMGDMVLVDGGILNNVPADVVKAMGADIVIAVDVGKDLSETKRSDTIFTVLGETLDVMMRAGVRSALLSADIVLAPDLRGMLATSFGGVANFARRGYDAAEAHRDELLRFAVPEDAYRAWRAAVEARRRTAVPTPDSLRIDGVTGSQASVIRRQLRRHLHRPIDTFAIDRDLTLLMGSARYSRMTYRIEEEQGKPVLVIMAREKVHGPPYLLGALDIQNADSSTVTAALRGRLTFFDVLTPGSEVRLDAGVGQTTRLAAEWMLAVGSRGLFVAPRTAYSRVDTNLFVGNDYVSQYRRVSRDGGLDVGYSSGRSLELRAGYARERLDAKVRIGERVLPDASGAQSYWRVRGVFDGQRSPVIPDRGLYVRAELREFIETPQLTLASSATAKEPDDLRTGEGYVSYAQRLGRTRRLVVSGAGGTAFGDTALVNGFALGGPLTMTALQRDAWRGSNYLFSSVAYFHEVSRIVEGAGGRIHVGGWIESGTVFERLRTAQIRSSVSVGVIAETVVGPAFVMCGVGTDGHYRVYAGLGPIFRR